MKGKMKLDEKGITLVALVVTVIILLILAGVTINIALSENGLFQKARKTAEEHNISEYLDRLKLASSSATLERQEKGFNTKEYMDFYAEEIKNDEKFKEADVSRVSEEKTETEVEEKIVVTTKEGYVFSVTEGEIEYLGKQGEKGLEEPPKLKEGDIKISQTPKEWTKETVEVEITTEITEYTLQYSLNGTNWYNYRGKLTIENNKTTVYGRLVNKLGQANGYASKEISTIDREAPNEINPTGIGNPTTIEVKVTATDKEETSKDGKSGIKKIYFSIYKDGNWVEEEEAGEDGKEVTHTFDKLNSETEYQKIEQKRR